KRINVFIYWMSSKHGTQSFNGFSKPWKMSTALGVYCNATGGFQSGMVDANLVSNIAASALPDYTVPIVMVHDPFNAMRANAVFGFGRVLMSAEDFRGGAVLTHELGHSIGNLADEYTYNPGATYTGAEPSMVNITIETDPAKVKWANLIKGNPPVPTPFGYDGYGIFEGAAPASFSIYRPTAKSLMRDTNYPFFKVNEAQLSNVLQQFKK
ncbi:MAG TPA: M64 family metallopeptidase, partial [Acidobacteriota bacterium]|nr:M64 family metallopeptidase [Acidobacteriota bacterium]